MRTVRMGAGSRVVALICLACLPVAGCSVVGPDQAEADSAAQRFHAALTRGQPAAACDLLAPETLKEVVQAAGSSCPKALTDEALPGAGTVTATDVYGTNARVVMDGDTLFLARFGPQWRVTAAGCSPRPDLPYDCQVKGS